MGLWQSVVKWFVKYAWPQIKHLLIIVLKEVINWLFRRLEGHVRNRGRRQEKQASAKATEHQQAADRAGSGPEAEQHRAIAQVWREVAEQFREENESLLQKIAELEEEGRITSQHAVSALEVGDVFDVRDGDIVALPSGQPILQLPPPSSPDSIVDPAPGELRAEDDEATR